MLGRQRNQKHSTARTQSEETFTNTKLRSHTGRLRHVIKW